MILPLGSGQAARHGCGAKAVLLEDERGYVMAILPTSNRIAFDALGNAEQGDVRDAEIGEDGLPMVGIGDAPFHQFLLQGGGYINGYYHLADYPDDPGCETAGQGAEDPASGVVAVMEAARLLARHAPDLDCTVRFVLWGIEEIGLLGGTTAEAIEHFVRGLLERTRSAGPRLGGDTQLRQRCGLPQGLQRGADEGNRRQGDLYRWW